MIDSNWDVRKNTENVPSDNSPRRARATNPGLSVYYILGITEHSNKFSGLPDFSLSICLV